MFEIDNPISRALLIVKVGGIEERVFIKIGSEFVKATPETDVDRTSAEGKASSVQYVHFKLNDEQITKFKSDSLNIELGIDHKEYTHTTKLTKDNVNSLLADFI
jgi:hypothetical protein